MSMSSIAQAVLFAIILLCLQQLFCWYRKRKQVHRLFESLSIPGPKPCFFTGNLSLTKRNHLLDSFDAWFEQYGDCVGYYRGDKPVLVTKNVQLIREVFVNRFKDFPNRLRFIVDASPFSSSVLALRDKRWRNMRKLITPALTSHKVSSSHAKQSIIGSIMDLFGVFDQNTNESIVLKRTEQQLCVNVSYLSKAFTLDVICKFALSINDSNVYKPNSFLLTMMEEFIETCDCLFTKMVFVFPFMKHLIKFINNYLTSGRIIDYLVRYLKNKINDYQQQVHSDTDDMERKTILDFMLLQKKINNLSNDETIGNLLVVLLAGYETTACCISFTLFLLAQHPTLQAELRDELKRIFKCSQSFHTSENFKLEINCELLDRIIYESLRLYPPVVDYVIREMTDSEQNGITVEYENKSLFIPKDVAIQVPVWTMHHDEQLWPNPYKFEPNRENLPLTSSNNCQFFAFGIGQRNCVGGNLAMSEMRMLIAAIIFAYQIELIDGDNNPMPYCYDTNGLLQIECLAELIRPVNDICLSFKPI